VVRDVRRNVNAARTAFAGALYSPRGTPFTSYDASRFQVGAPVGSATITFNAADDATLDYSIGGVTGTKAIKRQAFGPPAASAPLLRWATCGGAARRRTAGHGAAAAIQHHLRRVVHVRRERRAHLVRDAVGLVGQSGYRGRAGSTAPPVRPGSGVRTTRASSGSATRESSRFGSRRVWRRGLSWSTVAR
jgi:hypothetical protein